MKPELHTADRHPRGNRRRPLARDTLLAILLFGTAFWSMDALRVFDWLVEFSERFPALRIGQLVPALIFGLAGYVALTVARVHFLNIRLQVGERRMRFFMEHAPAAMAMFDAGMRCLESSLRWRSDLGLPMSGTNGLPLAEMLPAMPEGWRDLPGACLNGAVVSVEEESYRLPDGTEEWIHWTAHPWHELDPHHGRERIGGVILFVERITARKRAEAERRAREAAEAANQAKSAFLAVMSHEIRTPMSGTMAMVDQLATTRLDADQQQLVALLQRSNEALLGIINNILDFSKMEAGRLLLEAVPFALDQLLSDLRSLFEHPLNRKGVRFRLLLEPEVPAMLVGDPLRLRQILMNLLSNAVKFTSRGEIALEARMRSREGEVCHIVFHVRDSGVGMTGEQLEALFVPYVQADVSVSRIHGGTGLGLAICRQLADLMGGSITARSVAGEGTVFTLELAFGVARAQAGAVVVPEPLAPPVPVAADLPTGTGGARVLLVDDDSLSRQLTEVMLKGKVALVRCAESGVQALEWVARESFDLIFMDVRMPGMDGYETCRRIRAYESEHALPRTPVIALTGNVRAQVQAAGLAAGMDDSLTKPLRIKVLHDALDRWLTPSSAPEAPVVAAPSHPASGEKEEEEEIPLLEERILETLRQELSRVPGAFANILGMFLDDIDVKLEEIRTAMREQDGSSLSRVAHSMKSQCGSVGAARLRQLFVQMERLAKEGDLAAVPSILEEAERLFGALRPRLERARQHPDQPV
ncbi:MAG: response regulator [Magnetococcales bacterium]|nr:response regulator [Magnetococcales bacterium]